MQASSQPIEPDPQTQIWQVTVLGVRPETRHVGTALHGKKYPHFPARTHYMVIVPIEADLLSQKRSWQQWYELFHRKWGYDTFDSELETVLKHDLFSELFRNHDLKTGILFNRENRLKDWKITLQKGDYFVFGLKQKLAGEFKPQDE